jgi:hypothetical protein
MLSNNNFNLFQSLWIFFKFFIGILGFSCTIFIIFISSSIMIKSGLDPLWIIPVSTLLTIFVFIMIYFSVKQKNYLQKLLIPFSVLIVMTSMTLWSYNLHQSHEPWTAMFLGVLTLGITIIFILLTTAITTLNTFFSKRSKQ